MQVKPVSGALRLSVRSARFAFPAGLWLAFVTPSCGSPNDTSEPEGVGQSSQAIVGGMNSPSSANAVVRIVQLGTQDFCTGTLVAPDLVVTAQHCVVQTGFVEPGVNDIVDCQVGTEPFEPSQFQSVNIGNSTLMTEILAQIPVVRVFVNEGNSDCTQDVGFLQIAPTAAQAAIIQGLQIHPLLIDATPAVAVGDRYTQSGWGFTSDDGGTSTTRQQEKGKVTFLPNRTGTAVGPEMGGSVAAEIPYGWFGGTTRSCNGDSGSPWFDSSGNQIAVADQVVSPDPIVLPGGQQQSDCANSVTLATPLSNVEPFVTSVFQSVGRMPWRAGRPAPPNGLGGACTLNNECNSNYCVTVGTESQGAVQSFCSTTCTKPSDCPSPMTCNEIGTQKVCIEPQSGIPQAKCSIATGEYADGSGISARALAFGFVGVGLLGAGILRRKRRSYV